MKNYLVTGGCGFIGSNFIKYMLKKYSSDIKIINLDKLTYSGNNENLKEIENLPNYSFIRGDICDAILVADIFKYIDIDYVVNFAAESHVDRSIVSSKEFIYTNVCGVQNLLDSARSQWGKGGIIKSGAKFLQVSTDEVYGSLGEEGLFTESSPLCPRSPYSASKASADLLCLAYYETHGFPVIITRCSNNYGPYQYPEKLIPLMINKAISKEPLPVYGDGLNIRDWLFVDDHCAAIEKAWFLGRIGEVYNIGGHNEMKNIDIIKIILSELNKNYDNSIDESLISYVEDRPGHDRRYAIDPSKAERELLWRPEVRFEDGIIKTINWYLDNQIWLDDIFNKTKS